MSLELIDIALAERQPHPTLAERMTGKVRAVLTETIGGREVRHEILVPVWMDVRDGMSDEDQAREAVYELTFESARVDSWTDHELAVFTR